MIIGRQRARGVDAPRESAAGLPARRSRLGPLVGILVAVAVGVGVFVVDRRGARILAPAPGPTQEARLSELELPSSTMSLEVLYDLGEVAAAMEERIPRRFGDLDDRRVHPDDPRVTYAVALEREPLELELRGDTVRITAVVHYQGRVWFDAPLVGEIGASCGQVADGGAGPRAVVALASPLAVRPDWRIASNVRVEEIRPASAGERDRCAVALGPLRMDVTEPLLAAAESRMESSADDLAALIESMDLRSVIEPHWARIQDPIRLEEGVWLQIEPDSLRVGPVTGRGARGGILSARLALVGRPRIGVGARPPATRMPLPRLEGGPVRERFGALLESRIDYATASRLASEALRGRELDVAGRRVRIDDVQFTGLGDGRLGVGLDLAGAVRGRIYLVGTPAFDPATGDVTVPDLGFSVATRNVLLRGAIWLVRGTFADRIRRAVRWNADEVVEGARAVVAGPVDRDLGEGVRLEGTLGGIEVLGVGAAPEGLRIRSSLNGKLRLRVGPRSLKGTERRVGPPRPAASPGPGGRGRRRG